MSWAARRRRSVIVPPGIVGWVGGEAKLGTTLVTRASGCEPGEQVNRHDRTWIGNKREGAGRDEPGQRLSTRMDFCRMDFCRLLNRRE